MSAPMDDLTATRLCAEAAEIRTWDEYGKPYCKGHFGLEMQYWPLTNDAQAMALVKKFRLNIRSLKRVLWEVYFPPNLSETHSATIADENLNRAIIYCVAALHDNRGNVK